MPLCLLHVSTPPPELQKSIPLRCNTPAAQLLRQTPTRPYTRSTPPEFQSSIPLHLYVTYTRSFQGISVRQRPLPVPPRLHACSAPPDLHTSMSLHLQRTSRAPELHTSLPPHLHARSACPELHTSLPPRPQARSTAREGRRVLRRVTTFSTKQN